MTASKDRTEERLPQTLAHLEMDRTRLQELWSGLAETGETIMRSIRAIRHSARFLDDQR
jgi:hypothetical protein